MTKKRLVAMDRIGGGGGRFHLVAGDRSGAIGLRRGAAASAVLPFEPGSYAGERDSSPPHGKMG